MRLFLLWICISWATVAGAQATADLFNQAKQEKDPAQQVKLLSRVVAQSPRHVGAYHRRGDAYLALQKYPQAIRDYNRVISLRPKDPFRYYARGLAYTRMDQPALALADFSKAISLKPSYKPFYLDRARTYNQLGKYGPALDDYKNYKPYTVADTALLREMMPVALNAYRFDEARTLLRALQERGESSAPFYGWQGRILQHFSQLDEAISAYSKAVNRAPQEAQYYRMRGNAYNELGDAEQAIADFTVSLQLEPEAYWFNRRGLAYEETGQLENALADYDKAIALDPKWAVAYNNRGYVKALKKDYANAQKDFETAIKLDPASPTPYVNLAGIYWTFRKDRRTMYATLRKALAHNFKNTDSLYDDEQKGWLFKGINKTAEFRSLFYK